MGAALAAASVALQDIDPGYSATLLAQARQFYDFARTNQGFYSNSIPDAQNFYRCVGWGGWGGTSAYTLSFPVTSLLVAPCLRAGLAAFFLPAGPAAPEFLACLLAYPFSIVSSQLAAPALPAGPAASWTTWHGPPAGCSSAQASRPS